MKNEKPESRELNDEEKNLISREEAIREIGSFTAISLATLMVIIPTKQSAAGSSSPSPSAAPPPVPTSHGIW